MAKKQTLGTILREARLKRGLTLQSVGEAIGTSGSAVSHWERGANLPSDDNLTAVCKALRLPIRATREIAAG
jgi:transcriptional regulator with XRE-family HTH domain